MTEGYVTRSRLLELESRLTERDRAVITTLRRIRLASGRQLEGLHFTDSDARQRRRVLARLVDDRILTRLPRAIGGVRAGSAGFLYALGVAGQRLTNGTGPARGRRRERPWTPGRSFVNHTLAITELYVRLREAERFELFAVIDFLTEPLVWRHFHGPGGSRQVLKPDAYVRLGLGTHNDHWFVEVDLATESPAALKRQFDAYVAYWTSGREHARFGVFPRVLWLVPDLRRQEVVLRVAGRQPTESWQLFLVSRFDEAITRFAEGAAP